jgi:type IV pilus assembly protein PilO
LIGGLWLVFLVLGFFLFWKDTLTVSTQLETNIRESLDRLDTQSRLLLDRPAIEAELAQLEVQLPLLKMALPSERELASLLERINEVILDHELKLAEFTPKEPLNREVMRVVPVTVSVRGDGDAISRLPNYIAALSRQVSLKEFDMAYLPDEGGWKMTGELNAFAQLPLNAPQTVEVENP